MAKTYKVTMKNSLEIREAMRKRENSKCYKRLMAVALRICLESIQKGENGV